LVCDIDFGHEFWTPLTAMAAGEWGLRRNVRIWSVAWLVSYLEQLLHDVSELRQAGRTVD
jgi:hypothetical protein